MISPPAGVRIHLATGATDMRKGFNRLAILAQEVIKRSPYSGHLFLFRVRRGDLIKILWWDGTACVCSPSGWRGGASLGQ